MDETALGRIITSATDSYIPGVIALYNSVRINDPEKRFTCLVDDGKTEEILENLNIETLMVKREWLPKELPGSKFWPTNLVSMYSRLLVPELFDEDGLIWVDADAIVVNKLYNISLDKFPCAGTCSSTITIGEQVAGLCVEAVEKLPAIQSGVMIFNTEEWRNQDITAKCFHLMKMNYRYYYVVQSILSLALEGNFKQLPVEWNFFASERDITPNTLIAHFAGANCLPWTRHDIPNLALWNKYYNNGNVEPFQR